MKKSTLENSGLETAEPLYYITNQYNLREILSGGFIGTRYSFDDKYYEDLLDLSPGRIPLVSRPIDKSLLQQVNMHDPETSFAALLQIDQSKIDLKSCEAYREESSKTLSLAFSGAIHLKHVSAIHFLSEKDYKEFSSRLYSNMPNLSELFRITPDLIDDSSNSENLIEWLKGLPKVSQQSSECFTSLDRISGAVSLCIHYSQNRDQNKQFIKLLEKDVKVKKVDDMPSWFNVGLQPKTKEEISTLTDIDEIVFASAVTVLHKFNLNTVSQRLKILDAVKEILYSNSLSDEIQQIFEKSFLKIERIIRLEDDFEPFKSSTKHEALRGLLLFLLRPGHNELLSWNVLETNAGREAMLTALALSGIVIGRKGLETNYRQPEIDLEIAELIVDSINQNVDQKNKRRKISVKSKRSKSSKSIIQGTLLLPNDETHEQKSVSEKSNWKTIKEKISNQEEINYEWKDLAIKLSMEMGWNDCVLTVIEFSPKQKFLVESGNNNELKIRMTGFPTVLHELNIPQFISNMEKFATYDDMEG